MAQDSYDRRRQGTLVLRPAAPAHWQLRLGAAVDARSAGSRWARSSAAGRWRPSSRSRAARRSPCSTERIRPARSSASTALIGNAIRPNLNTNLDLSKMTIPEIIEAARQVRRVCSAVSVACRAARVPSPSASAMPRATRCEPTASATSIFSLIKNTRFLSGQNLQFRVEMFNATNTRNFGIPDRARQFRRLPQPVGDRRRQSAHLAGRPVHLLANDYNVQGPCLRPLDLPARIIPSS